MRFVDFNQLEKARTTAGFFVSDMVTVLGISKQKYSRWRLTGRCPEWAVRMIWLEAGDKCWQCLSRKRAIRQYDQSLK